MNRRVRSFLSRLPTAQIVLVAYQIVAVIVSVPLLVRGLRLLVDHVWTSNRWVDASEDWGAARLFLKGTNPFSVEGLRALGLEQSGFGHPPTTPFWFIPLAPLSVAIMGQILVALTMLALLVHILLCVEELRFPSRLITVLLVFSLVVGAPWMIEHFHVLQISEFIAFTYVLAWHHLRHDREVSAGICIGMACTLKLFPGLMVIYLLLARRWRAVIAAIASYLPVALVMTWGYGLRSWPMFFFQQGRIADAWIGHIRNASVHGIVLRLLTPTCVAQAMPRPGGTLLATFVALLVLVFAWWVTRREIRDRRQIDLPFALFTLVSAFLNPWIWEHYRVFLILPLLVVIRTIADAAVAEWRQRAIAQAHRPAALHWVAIGLSAAVVVVTICSLTDGVFDKEITLGQYRRSAGMAEAARHALHVRLHVLEVMNWLPWVLAIALVSGLLIWRRRRAPA